MKDKINVAELLRDCPSGMELDCTMYENLEFSHIDEKSIYPIKCRAKITDVGYNSYEFTNNGQPNHYSNAKCVIFPKGKTTWEGFHRPFVEGDIVSTESGMYIGIVKSTEDSHHCYTFCSINDVGDFFIDIYFSFSRFATEEEKAKLFKAIKDNGYCWNGETKTLKKLVEPKFRVGDKVKHKCDKNNTIITIIGSKNNYYYIQYYNNNKNEYQNEKLSFTDQDKYELIIDKFDINTLKPFDKVLVRDGNDEVWVNAFFGFCDPVTYKTCIFVTGNENWCQCIPYDGNEHLLGTTDDCEDHFKTW